MRSKKGFSLHLLCIAIVITTTSSSMLIVDNSPLSSGFSSLFDAVAAASDGDTIYVVPTPIPYNCSSDTSSNSTTTVVCSKNLALLSHGAIFDCKSASRALVVNSTKSFNISGFVFLNGNTGGDGFGGGAILVHACVSSVQICNCTFKSNVGGIAAGAVSIETTQNANIVITQSYFWNNSGSVGGLEITCNVNCSGLVIAVSNSTFNSNLGAPVSTATIGSGGMSIAMNNITSSVFISANDCLFSNNNLYLISSFNDNQISSAGGLCISYTTPSTNNNTNSILNCKFLSNVVSAMYNSGANTGVNPYGGGGLGIVYQGQYATISGMYNNHVIRSCTFSGNVVTNMPASTTMSFYGGVGMGIVFATDILVTSAGIYTSNSVDIRDCTATNNNFNAYYTISNMLTGAAGISISYMALNVAVFANNTQTVTNCDFRNNVVSIQIPSGLTHNYGAAGLSVVFHTQTCQTFGNTQTVSNCQFFNNSMNINALMASLLCLGSGGYAVINVANNNYSPNPLTIGNVNTVVNSTFAYNVLSTMSRVAEFASCCGGHLAFGYSGAINNYNTHNVFNSSFMHGGLSSAYDNGLGGGAIGIVYNIITSSFGEEMVSNTHVISQCKFFNNSNTAPLTTIYGGGTIGIVYTGSSNYDITNNTYLIVNCNVSNSLQLNGKGGGAIGIVHQYTSNSMGNTMSTGNNFLIANCIFFNNGLINFQAGDSAFGGGALGIVYSSSVTATNNTHRVSNCIFSQSVVSSEYQSLFFGGAGAGIVFYSNALQVVEQYCEVSFDNCVFSNSRVNAGQSTIFGGGGLGIVSIGGSNCAQGGSMYKQVNIANCQFDSNTWTAHPTGIEGGGGLGIVYANNAQSGFTYFNSNNNHDITNSSFTNNIASCSGGGIAVWGIQYSTSTSLKNSFIANNVAKQDGGGFYLQCLYPSNPCIVQISNLTVKNNNAGEATADVGASGGGIHSSNVIASLHNSTVNGNSVMLIGIGGGLYFSQNSSVSIRDSKIGNNTSVLGSQLALVTSGGLSIQNSAIFASDSLPVHVQSSSSNIVVSNTTLTQCSPGTALILTATATRLQMACENCVGSTYNLQGGYSLGVYSPGKQVCLPCPFGGLCFGSTSVKASEGFWGVHIQGDNPIFILEKTAIFTVCPYGYCEEPKGDELNQCAVGRNVDEPLCGGCLQGYTQALFSAKCVETATGCSTSHWLWLFGVVYVVGIVVIYMVVPVGQGWILIVFFFFYQTVPFVLPATTDLSGFVMSILSLEPGKIGGTGSSLLCLFAGLSTTQALVLPLLIVGGQVVTLGAITTIIWKIKFGKFRRQIVAAATRTALFAFTSVVSTSNKLLHCVPVDGMHRNVLFDAGETECWQMWQIVVVIALVALVAPAPFAAAFFTRDQMVKCKMHINTEHRVESRLRRSFVVVMTGPFKNSMWFWNSVVLFERLLLAVLNSQITDAALRSVVVTLSLVVCLGMQSYFQPFSSNIANGVSTAIIANLAIVGIVTVRSNTLFVGGLRPSQVNQASTSENLEILTTTLLLWPAIVLIISGAVEWRRRRKKGYKGQDDDSNSDNSMLFVPMLHREGGGG